MRSRQRGFTVIEIVVVVVLIGGAAAYLVYRQTKARDDMIAEQQRREEAERAARAMAENHAHLQDQLRELTKRIDLALIDLEQASEADRSARAADVKRLKAERDVLMRQLAGMERALHAPSPDNPLGTKAR